MKKPWLVALAVASSLILAGVAHAQSDIFISGKKIVVKDNVDAAKRKVVVVSKDKTFNVTGLDPTVGGAFFYLVDPALGQQSSEFFMPASGWTNKNGKFIYTDKDLVNGPVKKAKLKNGLLKLVLKGDQIDFPVLGAPLGEVGGVMSVTDLFPVTRICFLFPGLQGTVKKDSPTKGIFKAIKSEAPSECPSIDGGGD
jgi:hypothetical protein